MAAGDLIAANLADIDTDLCYQAELAGHLVGDGDPWVITRFDGPGDVENPSNLAARDIAPGLSSGVHTTAPGQVVFTAMPHELADAADVEEAVVALEAAWSLTSPTWDPLELHMLVPHRGHIYAVGWPSTVKVNRDYVGGGVASVVCAFLKTEPGFTSVPGGS